MSPSAMFGLLKDTYSEWSTDKAPKLGAALAYYTVFSLAPLLVIAIAIAGFVFGQEAAQGEVVSQLAGLVGQDAAGTIQSMIQNASQTGAGTIATIIGIVTLLFTASGVFGELQDSLNTIWGVQPRPDRGIWGTVKDRFFSFTMVLGTGFLLLVSLVVSTALSALGAWFSGLIPGAEWLWQIVNFAIAFGVTTLLFAAIFKTVPDAEVAWGDVWIGAAATALLFSVGRYLLGLYLGSGSATSVYGAAGSLIVVLLWVYYSAQILFFGAEFTQVYANRFGSKIQPADNAIPLSEEDYAKQGLPRERTVGQALARAEDGQPAGTANTAQPAQQPAAQNGLLATVGGFIAGIFLAARGSRRLRDRE